MNALATAQRAHVLDTLASRTTPETVAAKGPDGLATGTSVNLNPHYLYEQLIAKNDAETSRMNLVRMAVKDCAVGDWKKRLDGFVELVTEKHGKGSAQVQAARNHKSVLQKAYGALRFTGPEMEAEGFNNDTGYWVASKMATKTLKEKGINWQGIRMLSGDDKTRQRDQKAEKKALDDIQKNNPRELNESLQDYIARTAGMVEDFLESEREEKQAERIASLAIKVAKICGGTPDDNGELEDVLAYLADQLKDGNIIVPQPKSESDSATDGDNA